MFVRFGHVPPPKHDQLSHSKFVNENFCAQINPVVWALASKYLYHNEHKLELYDDLA